MGDLSKYNRHGHALPSGYGPLAMKREYKIATRLYNCQSEHDYLFLQVDSQEMSLGIPVHQHQMRVEFQFLPGQTCSCKDLESFIRCTGVSNCVL